MKYNELINKSIKVLKERKNFISTTYGDDNIMSTQKNIPNNTEIKCHIIIRLSLKDNKYREYLVMGLDNIKL